METIYGPNWGTTLALSFAITWAIGLTPPILLRFVFLSRPIGMWPAIAVVFGFAFFNLMLFVALGSQSKSHTVVGLMAFVSFYILRKGAREEPSPKELSVSSNFEKPSSERSPMVSHKIDTPKVPSSIRSNSKSDLGPMDDKNSEVQYDKPVPTIAKSPAVPSAIISTDEGVEELDASENVVRGEERWNFFLKYSSIANETITALWERGQEDYCVFDYMSELKEVVQLSEVVPSLTEEIVSTVVEKTASRLKISDVEDVQTYYQKIRLGAPDEAEEFKKIVRYLGDTVDMNILSEKFSIEEIQFPLIEKVELSNEQYYSEILATQQTTKSQIMEDIDEICGYGYQVETSEGGGSRHKISLKNKTSDDGANLEIEVDRRNLKIFLSVCKLIAGVGPLNEYIANEKPNFKISSEADGYRVSIEKSNGVRSFKHFFEFTTLLFYVRCLVFETKLT
jgi:hypothetical protein